MYPGDFADANLRHTFRLIDVTKHAHTACGSPRDGMIPIRALATALDALPTSMAGAALQTLGIKIKQCGLFDGPSISIHAALAVAAEASGLLGDQYIGTEHLLLGLAKQQQSRADGLAQNRNIEFSSIARAILDGRPSAGWPPVPDEGNRDYSVLRDRPTWDTLLLDALYSPGYRILRESKDAPCADVAPTSIEAPTMQQSKMDGEIACARAQIAALIADAREVGGIDAIRLVPVGSDETEMGRIHSIDPSRLLAVANACSRYINSMVGDATEILLLLGSRFDATSLPEPISRWLSHHTHWSGLVSEEIGIGFVDIKASPNLPATIIHEYAHLRLSRAFGRKSVNPLLNEGFAYSLETRFAYSMELDLPRVWPSIRFPVRRGILSQRISLSELLTRSEESPSIGLRGYYYLAQLFLAMENYPHCPISGLIASIGKLRLQRSSELVDFLGTCLGLDKNELDRRFVQFIGSKGVIVKGSFKIDRR